MPKVWNIHNPQCPSNVVYIGRPSKWGNPFVIGRDGNREEVLAKYATWLDGGVFTGLLDLDELVGRDVACFCAPLPCHGDILVYLANKMKGGEHGEEVNEEESRG